MDFHDNSSYFFLGRKIAFTFGHDSHFAAPSTTINAGTLSATVLTMPQHRT